MYLKTLTLIMSLLLFDTVLAQTAFPMPRSGSLNVGEWSFNWDVRNQEEGLELRDVRWKNVKVIHKMSLPVIRVQYNRNRCGPYQDRMKWGNLEEFRHVGTKVSSREWRTSGILEIGVFSQIGDYDIYQAYYFSPNGSMQASVFSRGWSCEITHRHHPYWRIDFDVEDPRNIAIHYPDGSRGGGSIVRQEANFRQVPDADMRFLLRNIPDGREYKGVYVRTTTSDEADENFDLGFFGLASIPGFSNKDAAIRTYKPSEDEGWEFGARGHLGYNSPSENWGSHYRDGKDLVLWIVHHLDHEWTDGFDEEGRQWHWTTLKMDVDW